ncbi:MAG: hypothetical protein AAB431_03275 [Patescibacteria group bacterium]
MEFPLKYERPTIPVVDLDRFRRGDMTAAELVSATEEFANLGVICLRDSRVTPGVQRDFRRTMLEIHGASPEERAAMDGKDSGYQFGMTPPGTEYPLDHSAWVASLRPEHRPLTIPGQADAKSRFMWAIGDRPAHSRWPEVNAGAKVPARFQRIAGPLNTWGNCMLDAGRDLAEVVAMGLKMQRETFSRMFVRAPHILGPTGSDFTNPTLGKVLAGIHYDFNPFTIHGKNGIRALICWTRAGEPFLVEIPDGCLLAQAGRALEWMTGGFFFAGMHEVVVTPESLEDAAAIIARGERAIRTSSNLFAHFATRFVMRPLGRFATPESLRRYPPIFEGDYASVELAQIGLFPKEKLALGQRVPPQYRRLVSRMRLAA